MRRRRRRYGEVPPLRDYRRVCERTALPFLWRIRITASTSTFGMDHGHAPRLFFFFFFFCCCSWPTDDANAAHQQGTESAALLCGIDDACF